MREYGAVVTHLGRVSFPPLPGSAGDAFDRPAVPLGQGAVQHWRPQSENDQEHRTTKQQKSYAFPFHVSRLLWSAQAPLRQATPGVTPADGSRPDRVRYFSPIKTIALASAPLW